MFFSKKKYSDQEILEGIKAGGSDEHLAFLYRKLKPKIKSWIKNNQGSEEEAQDIFQESILAFYQKVIAKTYPQEKSISAYLFTTAKNKWIDRVKEKSRYENELSANRLVQEEVGQTEWTEKRIEELLGNLGSSCQEVLTWSIFYRMSMDDIALRMGLANANVAKTKAYKCKQRLVKMVKDRKSLKAYLYHEE